MKIKDNYNHTVYACFIGYMVQAIINNFIPLLFLTFRQTYGVNMDQIALLVTVNFGVQLMVDIIASKAADKLGYRLSMILAHIFSTVGIVSLTILPEILSNSYLGLVIAVSIYAIGGGLLEVLVSPIVEACPTERKEATMSLLHSFYCWGHVGVVLISTIYFYVFGIQNWHYLAWIWALVPFFNIFYFSKVPIASLIEEGEQQLTMVGLFKTRLFWVMILLMVCSGASEQSISQWASAFAEAGLGVSKTVGDLAGPLFFAVLMGTARAFYGKYSEKLNLERFMFYSGGLCVVSYLLISLSPSPVVGLIGCGICGLSIGILWPGTFSIASKEISTGGTAMFAFLALAGDIGCMTGPSVVGVVSTAFSDNLKKGILAAIVFPALLLVALGINYKMNKARINNDKSVKCN